MERQFLHDPSWLPIHDKDLAFQRFLKYSRLQTLLLRDHAVGNGGEFPEEAEAFVVLARVTPRETNVDSLLSCSASPLHSGLAVVRDPTTGMLQDFTEVPPSSNYCKMKDG